MRREGVATVTLNAALDHSLECPGFRAGEVHRVEAHAQHPGGKGLNVAAFLAGWVRPVSATGFLGSENAAPFEALLRERGLEDRFLRVAGATRTNLKVLDPAAGQVTELNLPGVRVAPLDWAALVREVSALAAGRAWVVLAGSLPPGVGPEAYATLVRVAREAGARVALDTSGPALAAGVAAGPDLVKPNRRELEALTGRALPTREDVLAAARDLLARGVGAVVASLGEQGALLVTPAGACLAVPPRADVVSTVGAGDALLAGVLTALLEGAPPEACLRRGTAFAVGTLGRAGPVLPPRAELEALAARVRVEPL